MSSFHTITNTENNYTNASDLPNPISPIMISHFLSISNHKCECNAVVDIKETEKNIHENEDHEIVKNWGRPKKGRKKAICFCFCAGKIEFISNSYSQWRSWTGDLHSVELKTEIIETGKLGIKNYRSRTLSSGNQSPMPRPQWKLHWGSSLHIYIYIYIY